MEEKQGEAVAVINMKTYYFIILILATINTVSAQTDSTSITKANTYKKRVLESTEVDLLMSYYEQDGTHSAVNGGIGTEELNDITPTIIITTPIDEDDVLTIDAGISAYTSASSSDVNPFVTGASTFDFNNSVRPKGTPWQASSGASGKDIWGGITTSYEHSNDQRTQKWNASASFSKEYDYTSFGIGAGYSWSLFEKNTDINVNAKAFFDKWNAIYPTELEEFGIYGSNFQNEGYFENVAIWDSNGLQTNSYNPTRFNFSNNELRNTYLFSTSISQILSKSLKASVFADISYQEGLLSTPFQRVYFSDIEDYYIGNPVFISQYRTPNNTEVFHLADDNERLPHSRLKTPLGIRTNYYVNEWLVLKGYYRFYWDNWGLSSHTLSIDAPIKLNLGKYAIIPSMRYYKQSEIEYFAPYNQHLSTSEFYTSDYDLSDFMSTQYSLGIRYTDIFTKVKIAHFGLKTVNIRYSLYSRSDGLKANIASASLKFISDR